MTLTLKSCPECGGPAQVVRNGDWKCLASDLDPRETARQSQLNELADELGVNRVDIPIPRVLVCESKGVSIGDDLCVTSGSTHLWRQIA